MTDIAPIKGVIELQDDYTGEIDKATAATEKYKSTSQESFAAVADASQESSEAVAKAADRVTTAEREAIDAILGKSTEAADKQAAELEAIDTLLGKHTEASKESLGEVAKAADKSTFSIKEYKESFKALSIAAAAVTAAVGATAYAVYELGLRGSAINDVAETMDQFAGSSENAGRSWRPSARGRGTPSRTSI